MSKHLVIGRCGNCARAVRAEILPIEPGDHYARIGHIGRLGGCLVSHDRHPWWIIMCGRFPGGCEEGRIQFKSVHYALRKATPTKCGGACRGAKGPSCDCECGGDNHGANHS